MTVPSRPDSLPPEVLDLGQPLAVFRGSRPLSVIALIVGPLGVVLFPGAAIAAYATGGVKEGSPAGPILIVLAVVMALAGGYLIYAGLGMRKLRYAVCPGGVARIRGERVDVLPWEGLQVLVRFHGHPLLSALGTSRRFWIKNGPARWSVHYEVGHSDGLAQAVSEEIVRRGLEPALRRIAEGEGLTFGPITVDRSGITLKGRSLSWEQVSSAGEAVGQGVGGAGRRVTIKQVGSDREWGSVEDAKVPNLELLLALIRKMRPGALGG